jgi:LEM-3-like GIY-YIG domain
VKKLKRNTKVDAKLRQCYVYEIRIDGVVRYVGKGRNGRIYSHLIDAKRTASRSDVKISNLSPHFRKMLVSAVRRGSNIVEKMVASNITDGEAYTMERQMIGNYHKRHAGQLWNTIDERFMDPKHLPKKWANPVNPLYRLSRPLNELLDRSMARPSRTPTIATVE